jgi:hypothetical protein
MDTCRANGVPKGIPFKRGESERNGPCTSGAYRGWRTNPFLRGAASGEIRVGGRVEETPWEGLEPAKSKRNDAPEGFREAVETVELHLLERLFGA